MRDPPRRAHPRAHTRLLPNRRRRRGQAVVVSFVETWNARAFHAQGAATRGTLAHTWRFFETRRARIRREVTFGDFPPQWVR